MNKCTVTENLLKEKTEEILAWYASQKCGYHVKEVHRSCHRDCFVIHPDEHRRIPVNGGWHAEGGISHSLVQTAERVLSLAKLNIVIGEKEMKLAEKVLSEVRYGTEWILRTRFGDGYRCVYAEIDRWTKGIIGDEDDMLLPANNDPFAGFYAAAAEAAAAMTWKFEDAVFAEYCTKSAEEDFQLAYERMFVGEKNYDILYQVSVKEMMGIASYAAALIYKITQKKEYIKISSRFLRDILNDSYLEAGVLDICERNYTELLAAGAWMWIASSENTEEIKQLCIEVAEKHMKMTENSDMMKAALLDMEQTLLLKKILVFDDCTETEMEILNNMNESLPKPVREYGDKAETGAEVIEKDNRINSSIGALLTNILGDLWENME